MLGWKTWGWAIVCVSLLVLEGVCFVALGAACAVHMRCEV